MFLRGFYEAYERATKEGLSREDDLHIHSLLPTTTINPLASTRADIAAYTQHTPTHHVDDCTALGVCGEKIHAGFTDVLVGEISENGVAVPHGKISVLKSI